MPRPIQIFSRLSLVCAALTSLLLLSCTANNEKIDFEFNGRVLDKETRQPIENAYVIAIYKGISATDAGVASRCIKTKGMYTGKDGSFHFPVEKRDGRSPFTVEAIHLDYIADFAEPKSDIVHRQQNAESYSDRNIYMKRQDPKNPDSFGRADVYCLHAKSPADVVASVEYFRVKRTQDVKLFNASQAHLDNLDSMIRDLETLDGRPPDAKRDEGSYRTK